jgi:hypothetical protein
VTVARPAGPGATGVGRGRHGGGAWGPASVPGIMLPDMRAAGQLMLRVLAVPRMADAMVSAVFPPAALR